MTGDDEVFSDLDRDAQDAIEAMNETAQEEFEQRQKIKKLIDEGLADIDQGYTSFAASIETVQFDDGRLAQVQIVITTNEDDFI